MINFDVVDFSERCSEEVISFFWHSAYKVYVDVPSLLSGKSTIYVPY